jgi:hypothetical protein
MRELMMAFNLESARRGARNGLDFSRNRPNPTGRDPIGNYGFFEISGIVECTIFGLADEALALVPRANGWIDQGLESREYEWFNSPPAQHRHNLHWGRALGTWLEDNELDEFHWNEARRYLEVWWRGPDYVFTRQEINRYGLDDYLAFSVLGGCFEDYKHGKEPFEAGIETYEYWTGKTDVSVNKALKPKDFGYALCRHYLNNEFDRADILKAGRRMLAANLTNGIKDGWLENGQSKRAAMWLMLVYWYPAFHYGEPLPSPVDVLLKAYDDMPGVVRPF